jgi:hypothetical protein
LPSAIEAFNKEIGEAHEAIITWIEVNGFRIAGRTTLAEDKIQLGIQVAANGAILPLEIQRVGNEWKQAGDR